MSHSTPRPPARVYTESEVRGILARAAELEASGGGGMLTAADLRKVAADAGIDATALEQAIQEASRGTAGPIERSDLLSVLTVKNLGLFVAGGILGSLAIAADGGHLGNLTALGIFGPSAAFTAWRAIRHRRRGSVGAFLREMGVLFSAFALVIAMDGGSDGLAAAVAWGVMCVVGGTAIANRPRAPEPQAELTPGP